jgi:hypothetical protein
MQQVDANDPSSATGALVDFGSTTPEPGAVTLRLDGTFF